MSTRILKGVSHLAYLVLFLLTWKWFRGQLGWGFTIGALLLSGFWLVLTELGMRQLMRTYFDVLSRLTVTVPVALGSLLSILAALTSPLPGVKIAAGLELALWAGVYLRYRLNRRHYIQAGHGLLPAGCLVNPPATMISPLDVILTGGRIADRIQQSVGHAELVIRLESGRLGTFTSLMEEGAVVEEDLDKRLASFNARSERYIVLRLNVKPTSYQIETATKWARANVSVNRIWRDRTNKRRARFFNSLPLPREYRQRLIARWSTTGYRWAGFFVGRLTSDHWTCIEAVLKNLRDIKIKVADYGLGFLSLGSGIGSPIDPPELIADPALRPLSNEDKPNLVQDLGKE